jgi:hypothetical protein
MGTGETAKSIKAEEEIVDEEEEGVNEAWNQTGCFHR